MLTLIIPEITGWDEKREEFVVLEKEEKILLEHSLISISKWETKWKKPFLTDDPKTIEESVDYIKCMTVSKNVDPSIYERLRVNHIEEVNKYINESLTATWFGKDTNRDDKSSKRTITSELIYCWMVIYHIPVSFEKWHISRLLTLIRVCKEEMAPSKKRSNIEIINERKAMNEARKKKWNTKG